MSKLNFWPPTRNESAPSVNNRIIRAIERVARIPDVNKPVFRLVWGQDDPYCRQYAVAMDRKIKLGNPIFNAQGKIETLGKVYETGDPAAPPGAVQLEQRIIIGPPRWLLQYGTSVSRNEWEAARYRELVPGDPLTRIDARGEYPENGVMYDLLGDDGHGGILMIKEHQQGCEQPKGQDWFGCCYGRYQEPTWRHVEVCQAIWKNFQIARSRDGGDYGFREEDNSHHVAWGARSAMSEARQKLQTFIEQVEDEAAQILTPYSIERLSEGGQGMPADMQRFHDYGSRTTSARDNHSRTRGHHVNSSESPDTAGTAGVSRRD